MHRKFLPNPPSPKRAAEVNSDYCKNCMGQGKLPWYNGFDRKIEWSLCTVCGGNQLRAFRSPRGFEDDTLAIVTLTNPEQTGALPSWKLTKSGDLKEYVPLANSDIREYLGHRIWEYVNVASLGLTSVQISKISR